MSAQPLESFLSNDQEATPAAGIAGNNSKTLQWTPLLCVSVARTDRIYISRDDILASGGVRVRPLLLFFSSSSG